MTSARLIQTYLPDGTLEGIRVIELSESAVKGVVIPRLKLKDAHSREELKQPALYFLINSGDNQIYIGESENFLTRLKNHDQAKDFWDVAVAIVSEANKFEKSDVKYLESLAVERAQQTAASSILNRTVPARNTIHEFKVHSLDRVLEDTGLILESIGYSVFTPTQKASEIRHCKTKLTNARAEYRGDNFVVLAGSVIDKSHTPSLEHDFPAAVTERKDILQQVGKDLGSTVELLENVPFRSANHAGGFVTGRKVNAWTIWKDAGGRTMDEVVRKGVEV